MTGVRRGLQLPRRSGCGRSYRLCQGGQQKICLGCGLVSSASAQSSESTSKADKSLGSLRTQAEQDASSPPVPPQDAALQPGFFSKGWAGEGKGRWTAAAYAATVLWLWILSPLLPAWLDQVDQLQSKMLALQSSRWMQRCSLFLVWAHHDSAVGCCCCCWLLLQELSRTAAGAGLPGADSWAQPGSSTWPAVWSAITKVWRWY